MMQKVRGRAVLPLLKQLAADFRQDSTTAYPAVAFHSLRRSN